MAIRNIIKINDPLLREISAPVKRFDESLSRLVDDMFQTMTYANGVGLACVQVGILRRICVVGTEEFTQELINPVITHQEGEQESVEGCLSVPNKHGVVKRPYKVTVEAFDKFGEEFTVEAEGFLAVVLCHEIDHLDGKMYVDKVIEYVD